MPERLSHVPYSTQQLETLRTKLREKGPAYGYPKARLVLPEDQVIIRDNIFILPDPPGPYEVKDHPNRKGKNAIMDPEVPSPTHERLSAERTAVFIAQGLLCDQFGRPINPNWRQMLPDPELGLPTSIGDGFFYGKNRTADAAVYRRTNTGISIPQYEWLFIQRKSNSKWAMPGGYWEPSDATIIVTALRETAEETGLLDIAKNLSKEGHVVFDALQLGRNTSLHKWNGTEVVLIHGNQEYLHDTPLNPDKDEVVNITWVTYEKASKLNLWKGQLQYLKEANDALIGN